MKVLLDTNVISELRRPGAHPGIRAMLGKVREEDQFVSVVSLGEISYGVAVLPAGKRRDELQEWLGLTARYFSDRVLTIDGDIAMLWGEIAAKGRRAGRVISVQDGLIAATALHYGLHVMTRNVSDFDTTGVLVINPWDENPDEV
ncbi:MAG TPA: type II toxin-antitoxin system VapC family toxin [Tepidisphaeraceae bacterium]|nr:type II toxin-antitoxin system VapC family toxin [Tepidisphaeraceae bacterium]